MIERLLLWSVAATLARGQDASTTSGSTSSSTGDGSSASETGSSTTRASFTHTVDVGLAGHTYQPDVILADVGDTVEFNFFPTNHSVIRAEYLRPCVPYEMTGRDKVGKGFDSTFLPVDAILDNPPRWSLLINDTDPIFFYCGAEGSCINWQMVGVINPNSSTSLEAHKQAAKDSDFMLLPGEKWPDEATDPMNSDTASSDSSSSSSSSSASGSGGSSSGLSHGAIAGIAVSVTVAVVAAAAFIFFCGRQSHKKKQQGAQNQQTPLMQQQTAASPDPNHFARMSMQPYPDAMYRHDSMQFDPHHSVALPGYLPPQGEQQRSYMAPMYGASEALNAGPPSHGTPQTSPNMGPVASQAYGPRNLGQQPQQGYFSPPIPPANQYHEMPALAAAHTSGATQARAGQVGELGDSSPSSKQPSQQQPGGGGIMGFIKQNTG